MIDAAALRAADVIVVDTDEHLAALPARHRPRAVVVAVGAPTAWHEAGLAGQRRDAGTGDGGHPRPLRVVFYGLYTPLQGAPVIGTALGGLAGAAVEITMIGRGQDEARTREAAAANDAVCWLDWVPAAELPGVVAGHDVCLGIFGTGEKARRVVPNKVFQGAAAGCAIVTSDTAAQRRVLGDAAILVPPGDADALAAALLRLAADHAARDELGRRARELAGQRFSPAQVVGPLVERLAMAAKESAHAGA
jgi:glycosyltransferase involved in cell wall biosynthesis